MKRDITYPGCDIQKETSDIGCMSQAVYKVVSQRWYILFSYNFITSQHYQNGRLAMNNQDYMLPQNLRA